MTPGRYVCDARIQVRVPALLMLLLRLGADEGTVRDVASAGVELRCTLETHEGPHADLLSENAEGSALWARWTDQGPLDELMWLPDCPAGDDTPGASGDGCCQFLGHQGGHTWEVTDPELERLRAVLPALHDLTFGHPLDPVSTGPRAAALRVFARAGNGAEDEGMEHTSVVRPARPEDLPRLVELIHEHIAYEKSEPRPPGLADRLGPQLFAEDSRLWVLLARTPAGEVAGYAACSTEYAFWDARHHLHMDCLYLAEDARGHGLGAALMEAVAALARELGLDHVEWQTPDWNEGAIRFYDRLGATGMPKRRYALPVAPPVALPGEPATG
ncbi:GNAT family N-acetyltransferase [Streptomyces sp. H27-G5]|uniref:GNAT family N-acetyltransferase n=1 Tax=Streptomyces sp. H27-G5 TaxID=2996698 RepID=UPI002D1E3D69|nr:GNAT family N-acetyltransferase [Streptomyces sp. H27-G5]